jgi:hypothetical protein
MLAEITEAARVGRETGSGGTMQMFDAVHAANQFLAQVLHRNCNRMACLPAQTHSPVPLHDRSLREIGKLARLCRVAILPLFREAKGKFAL